MKESTLGFFLIIAWCAAMFVAGYNFQPHQHGAAPNTLAAGHF